MMYKLANLSGDTVAVPQLIFSHLARTDGDMIRVALYVLSSGCTDARTIAHDLGLKSVEAANRALQYWAGAGLLEKERGSAQTAAPAAPAAEVDLSAINDPYVGVLCEEAQTAFGKALSRSDLQRLVGLYLTDGWQPDVVLLCCAEVARQGRRTVGAVARELVRWREAGVETGEDAERHLRRMKQREEWCVEAAGIFGIEPHTLTQWDRRAVARWHEEWHIGRDMIEEALLRAENHRTIRYVDGILRSWRSQGLTTVQAVRGKGALSPANILATGKTPAKPMKDMFNRNWNAVFDEETEG